MTLGHTGADLDPVRFDLNLRGEIIAEIVIMPLRADVGALPVTHRAGAPFDDGEATETETATEEPKVKRERKPRKVKSATVDETAHYRAEAA